MDTLYTVTREDVVRILRGRLVTKVEVEPEKLDEEGKVAAPEKTTVSIDESSLNEAAELAITLLRRNSRMVPGVAIGKLRQAKTRKEADLVICELFLYFGLSEVAAAYEVAVMGVNDIQS